MAIKNITTKKFDPVKLCFVYLKTNCFRLNVNKLMIDSTFHIYFSYRCCVDTRERVSVKTVESARHNNGQEMSEASSYQNQKRFTWEHKLVGKHKCRRASLSSSCEALHISTFIFYTQSILCKRTLTIQLDLQYDKNHFT